MSERLRHFYQTPKHLHLPSERLTKKGKRFVLVSLLEVRGVVKEGYRFRIKCLCEHPNKKVTIQIEYNFRDKWPPLVRIDWKPGRKHTNPGTKKVIIGSHIHPPEEKNIKISIIRGKIPFAEKLPEDPESWQDLMKLAGKLLHVVDLAKIPEPDWCPTLLQL